MPGIQPIPFNWHKVVGHACVRLRSVLKQCRTRTVFTCGALNLVLAINTLALEFPGRRPGPAAAYISGTKAGIRNRVLSAAWQFGESGLTQFVLRDELQQKLLSIDGELWEVILAGGRRYPFSQLQPDGPARIIELQASTQASQLAARSHGLLVETPMRTADQNLALRWRVILRDDANYLRQEIVVSALRDDCVVEELTAANMTCQEARNAGQVDGSPLVASTFFLGLEDPHAMNRTDAGRVCCRVPRLGELHRGNSITNSFVAGVAPSGQMRRAFLYYLERERAHPYRPFLHYNSWYDIAWTPFALNETNCLNAIRLFGDRFIKPHHIVMDAMVFDDGWDNPKSLWEFHTGFPHGFAPLAELCNHYNTRLGVWLSPFGGYGEPKDQRLKYGVEQGFETNRTGFSLAGPKYYAAFRNACLHMISAYGVNHFKFDGIAAGMYANGSAEYLRDTIAMRRLMLELRQESPDLFINLTTGSWPSPFWLRYTDSVWRQGGDMGLAGKGTRQQQWLTYRDQEVYRNIVGKGPLFPLSSLMTQGVAYSRQGAAGDASFSSAGFKSDVRAFFGSGTALQELYLQPERLTPGDWQVLAETARWSRAHAEVLVDTHWIGGDPSKLQVYGYASWTPHKGIVMLRNPDDQPQDFLLDPQTAFELPAHVAGKFRLKSPWLEDQAQPVLTAVAGKPLRLALSPFEVVMLETLP